jgi:hypothetical protein
MPLSPNPLAIARTLDHFKHERNPSGREAAMLDANFKQRKPQRALDEA